MEKACGTNFFQPVKLGGGGGVDGFEKEVGELIGVLGVGVEKVVVGLGHPGFVKGLVAAGEDLGDDVFGGVDAGVGALGGDGVEGDGGVAEGGDEAYCISALVLRPEFWRLPPWVFWGLIMALLWES